MNRNKFTYFSFVKSVVDNNDMPVIPSGMARDAMDAGAMQTGDDLHKRLREACNALASQSGYKRIRVKGVKGYQFCKV